LAGWLEEYNLAPTLLLLGETTTAAFAKRNAFLLNLVNAFAKLER
jgi:hypothetical protein